MGALIRGAVEEEGEEEITINIECYTVRYAELDIRTVLIVSSHVLLYIMGRKYSLFGHPFTHHRPVCCTCLHVCAIDH